MQQKVEVELLLLLIFILLVFLQVTEQVKDEKIGRMVTRVVLPRVVMHSRYHYGVSPFYLILVMSFWFLKQDKNIRKALSNC